MSTGIAWCDETINPIRAQLLADDALAEPTGWHCERVSQGCEHCYAETRNIQRRMNQGTGLGYNRGARDLVRTFFDEKRALAPTRWTRRAPQRVFWCSMTDVFGEWVPDEYIDQLLAAVALAPRHTHIFLTKRPQRMREYMSDAGTPERVGMEMAGHMVGLRPPSVPQHLQPRWPPQNVIMGVSIEDQKTADERLRILRHTPAACTVVSLEPQIEAVDLGLRPCSCYAGGNPHPDCLAEHGPNPGWILQGGESGKGARPFDVQWARDVRDQCAAAGVPYFLKQLGAAPRGLGEELCDRCFHIGPGGRRASHGTDCDGRQLQDIHGGNEAEWPVDLRDCRAFPVMSTRGTGNL